VNAANLPTWAVVAIGKFEYQRRRYHTVDELRFLTAELDMAMRHERDGAQDPDPWLTTWIRAAADLFEGVQLEAYDRDSHKAIGIAALTLQTFVETSRAYLPSCEACDHVCPLMGDCAQCGSDPMLIGDKLCITCDRETRGMEAVS
jgi:hypothetical protein